MILLQKFVLFLGHPTYSFAVVLGSLLLSTGAGSMISDRQVRTPRTGILCAVAGIALYASVLMMVITPVAGAMLQQSLGVRMGMTALCIIPLGLLMGMMFPCGIRLLQDRAEAFVPWAWGINGSASVVGSVLSLYLAIQIGFTALMMLAVGIYLIAGWMAIRSR